MAEAIGVVASVIAIGQAIGTLPKIVATIRALKPAISEIDEVLDEAVMMRALTSQIDRYQKNSEVDRLALIAVSGDQSNGVLAPCQSSETLDGLRLKTVAFVSDLEQLARHCTGKRHKSLSWIWNRDKIAQLSSRARNTREALMAFFTLVDARAKQSRDLALGTLMFESHVTTGRTLDLVGQHSQMLLYQTSSLQRIEQRLNELHLASGRDNADDSRHLLPGTQPNPSSSPDATVIPVTARKRYRCTATCGCRCHAKLSTSCTFPRWLEGLAGRFKLEYWGTPLFNSRCNERTCRSSAPSTEFTYTFPAWAINWGISIGIQNSAFGRGGSIFLDFPRVFPTTHEVWYALRYSETNTARRILCESTIKPSDVDGDGVTLLDYAFMLSNYPMVRGVAAIVDILLGIFAISDMSQIKDRSTVAHFLHLAESISTVSQDASPESASAREKILSLVSTLDREPPSYVHDACRTGDLLQLKAAIERDQDSVNSRDEFGQTPLTLACAPKDLALARVLLAHGANPDTENSSGVAPLETSCWWGNLELVEFLLGAGCNPKSKGAADALHRVLQDPDPISMGILHVLLEAGVPVNEATSWSVVPIAAINWSEPMIASAKFSMLISRGADIERRAGPYGYTPLLHVVCYNLHISAQELYNAGASVLASSFDSANVLHFASMFGDKDMFKVIEKWDLSELSVESKDMFGDTPLDNFKYRWISRRLDVKIPSEEVMDLFLRIYSKARETQVNMNLDLLEEATGCISLGDIQKARQILRQLQDRRRQAGVDEDVETIRVISDVQLPQDMINAAIDALRELGEVWVEFRETPPMEIPSRWDVWIGANGYVPCDAQGRRQVEEVPHSSEWETDDEIETEESSTSDDGRS